MNHSATKLLWSISNLCHVYSSWHQPQCDHPYMESTVIKVGFCRIVEPVYYGHLGTKQRCPDYQGVLIFQVSLYDKAPFGTIARCPDYAGVHIFKCPD